MNMAHYCHENLHSSMERLKVDSVTDHFDGWEDLHSSMERLKVKINVLLYDIL